MPGVEAEHNRVGVQKRLLCSPQREPAQADGSGLLRSCLLEQAYAFPPERPCFYPALAGKAATELDMEHGRRVEVPRGLCSQTMISFGWFYCPSTGKQVAQWPHAVLSSAVSFDSRSPVSFPSALLDSELHARDLGQVPSFLNCQTQESTCPERYKTRSSQTSANEGDT